MVERLFKSKMALYGDTQWRLAAALGIARQTLARKIADQSAWTDTEISFIVERYKLTNEEMNVMFKLKGN